MKPESPEFDLLTIREVQAILKVGRSLTYDLVWRGKIKSIRIGRSVRIRRSELQRFIESNSQ